MAAMWQASGRPTDDFPLAAGPCQATSGHWARADEGLAGTAEAAGGDRARACPAQPAVHHQPREPQRLMVEQVHHHEGDIADDVADPQFGVDLEAVERLWDAIDEHDVSQVKITVALADETARATRVEM